MDRGAASIACVIAAVTAHIHIEDLTVMDFGTQTGLDQFGVRRMIRPAADRAEHAHQALRQNAIERRNKVVRLDSHIQKTTDHADDVVRVYGREYELAGYRSRN